MVPEPAERSQGPPGRRRFRPRQWRDYLESGPGRKHHVSGARGPGERGAPGGAQWLARGAVPPGAAVRAAAAPHILRRHCAWRGCAAGVAAFLLGLVAAPAGACLRPGPAPSSLVSGVGPRGARGGGDPGCRGPTQARLRLARRSPGVLPLGCHRGCGVVLRSGAFVSVLVECIRHQQLCAGEAGRRALTPTVGGRRDRAAVVSDTVVGVAVPSRCREN